MTLGERYNPAMKIQTQEEADAFLEGLIKSCIAEGYTRTEAEQMERVNVVYYSGYHDKETRERIERLFKAKNPAVEAMKIKQLEAIAAQMHAALCNVESYCLKPGSQTFAITNKTMVTVCDATRAYRGLKEGE